MSATVLDADGGEHFSSSMLTLDSNAAAAGSGGGWSLDFSSLVAGTYTVRLTATDKVGNSSTTSPIEILVDKDIPVLSLNSPLATGAVFNAKSTIPANWTGSASDAFLDSLSLKSVDWPGSFSAPSSGTTRTCRPILGDSP